MYSVYVVNYHDALRRQRMIDRFSAVGVSPKFTVPIENDDCRLRHFEYKRIANIMWNHLECLRCFLQDTNDDYVVVCEDDIYISRTFTDDIQHAIHDYVALSADVLLLGYLLPFRMSDYAAYDIVGPYKRVSLDGSRFRYYSYHDEHWGTQMYMMNRRHAQHLLEYYTEERSMDPSITFSSDWTITKYGRCLMIDPMFAVEEGDIKGDDPSQVYFHNMCASVNYDPLRYM